MSGNILELAAVKLDSRCGGKLSADAWLQKECTALLITASVIEMVSRYTLSGREEQ